MKKVFIFLVLMLPIVAWADDEKVIAEMDWTSSFWLADEGTGATCEMTAEGLAITNTKVQENLWTVQAQVLKDVKLKQNHIYKVTVTAKIPSDGELQMNLGSGKQSVSLDQSIPVGASDDFKNFEFLYEDFPADAEDGHVLFQNGGIVGTSIVKCVRILDVTDGSDVMNWNSPYWFWDEGTGATCEMTAEGVAITNTKVQENRWTVQTQIIKNAKLKQNHNYKVIVIAKIPSDGELQMNLGSGKQSVSVDQSISVGASDDFQSFEFLFEDFPADAEDGHVLFQSGGIVGTCIVKKVRIVDVSLEDVMDWTSPYWFGDEGTGAICEMTAEGVAITNTKVQENLWTIQTKVLKNVKLKKDHTYKVLVMAKIPSAGELQMNLCSDEQSVSVDQSISVGASDDFQSFEFLFEDFPADAEDGHVLFQSGGIVGTCIVKKVRIVDVASEKMMDWTSPYWFWDEGTGATCEMSADGIAITNTKVQENLWTVQTKVLKDAKLKKNHNYKVLVTAKIPSAGELQMNLGSGEQSVSLDQSISVGASDDFQNFVFLYEDFPADAEDGHVLFQSGGIVGTCVVNNVRIVDVTDGEEDIAEMDWTSPYWFGDEGTGATCEMTVDGVAITNTKVQENLWAVQTKVLKDAELKQNHNYEVIVTAKIPSAGELQMNLCSDEQSVSLDQSISVGASDDFQNFVFLYEDFPADAKDGHVLFQSGGIVGTSIVKNVRIIDVTDGIEEMDWTSPYWFGDEGTGATCEMTADGIAITNTKVQENLWTVQTKVLKDAELKQNHTYKVLVMAKIPSAGELQMNLCSDEQSVSVDQSISVGASDDFQSFEFLFEDFPADAEDGHVLFQSGGIVGTCIVKKVRIVDVASEKMMDWTSPYWFGDEGTGVTCEMTADGIAITNTKVQENLWTVQTKVLKDTKLKQNHTYKVIVTAKIPSDGELQMNLCSDAQSVSLDQSISVGATDDFQNYEFLFEDFPADAEDGHVMFQNGGIVGTCIVKSVRIIDVALEEEMDWTSPYWIGDEGTGATCEMTAEGIAITNTKVQENLWTVQTQVLKDAELKKNHNYKVIVTAKIPSAGELQVQLGSWGNNYINDQSISVGAFDEFQNIELLFQDFPVDAKDGHVLFQNGGIVGTCVVKSVKVIDLGEIPVNLTNNALYPNDLATRAGNQPTLGITMDNESQITALQFDLVLPEGITVANDEDGMIISLSTRALKSHTVAKSVQKDGSIRIICSSNSSAVFSGSEGSVIFVKLDINKDLADGEYTVAVNNIELSSSDGIAFHPENAKATITVGGVIAGDVDNNGSVTVNDAVCIVRDILGLSNKSFVKAAADLDGNGSVTINDKVVLVNRYILGKNKARTRGGDEVADNSTLTIDDLTMMPGETRAINVLMTTDRTDIEALQCDIYLPDGLEFVASEEEGEKYYADKGGRATRSHSVVSFIQEDGALRVVESTDDGTAFRQNDLPVFNFTVKAANDIKNGNYTIRLANMELSYGEPINPADANINVTIDNSKSNTITISSAKQVPYCSDRNLDFTDMPDLKAYVATGYDKAKGTIWLTRVKQVPAETGFLLIGDPGDYDIPVVSGVFDVYYKNMFKGTLEEITIQTTEGKYTNYYLSNGKSGVGFYKVTNADGQKINANRCYLPILTDIPADGSEGDAEIIKVSAAKQVPYYTSKNIDFTSLDAQGVKAYTATGYNYGTGVIWLTRVKKVPAQTGILVMADVEGDYNVPTTSVQSVYENMFVGSETAQTIYTNEEIGGVDYVNYYLSKGDAGVGFYKVTNPDGVKMGANRCYLPIPKRDTASGARGKSGESSFCKIILSDESNDDVIAIPLFADDATGIEFQSSIFNLQSNEVYYNLQGQRVDSPGKGLYIRNGVKVVINN